MKLLKKMCSIEEHSVLGFGFGFFWKSVLEFLVRARDTEFNDLDCGRLRVNERRMTWDSSFFPESPLGCGRMAEEAHPPMSLSTRPHGVHTSSKHVKGVAAISLSSLERM